MSSHFSKYEGLNYIGSATLPEVFGDLGELSPSGLAGYTGKATQTSIQDQGARLRLLTSVQAEMWSVRCEP